MALQQIPQLINTVSNNRFAISILPYNLNERHQRILDKTKKAIVYLMINHFKENVYQYAM